MLVRHEDSDRTEHRERAVPICEASVADLGLDERLGPLFDATLELDAHLAELEMDVAPCEELARLEGFDEVVVGTLQERLHTRLGASMRGEEDYGDHGGRGIRSKRSE